MGKPYFIMVLNKSYWNEILKEDSYMFEPKHIKDITELSGVLLSRKLSNLTNFIYFEKIKDLTIKNLD